MRALKDIYHYTNSHLRELIAEENRKFWWFFSMIIIPIGLIIYSFTATYMDRLDGVSEAAGISFREDLVNHHTLSLVFGITFLIAFLVGFFSTDINDIIRWHTVNTAGRMKEYSPEEVDAQANAPESEWLPAIGIILAPEIIIGFHNGIMVARYVDVELLKVETRPRNVHLGFFKWKKMESIILRPSGNKVNEITLAESIEDSEMVLMEIDIIREKCQKYHPDKEIKIQKPMQLRNPKQLKKPYKTKKR